MANKKKIVKPARKTKTNRYWKENCKFSTIKIHLNRVSFWAFISIAALFYFFFSSMAAVKLQFMSYKLEDLLIFRFSFVHSGYCAFTLNACSCVSLHTLLTDGRTFFIWRLKRRQEKKNCHFIGHRRPERFSFHWIWLTFDIHWNDSLIESYRQRLIIRIKWKIKKLI